VGEDSRQVLLWDPHYHLMPDEAARAV